MKKQEIKKQGGFVLTSELVLLVTVLVIGMTVGLVSMRDAINAEMHDVAEAVGHLNQSYEFEGIINSQSTAEVAGSAFTDTADLNAGDEQGWTFVVPTVSESSAAFSITTAPVVSPSAAGTR